MLSAEDPRFKCMTFLTDARKRSNPGLEGGTDWVVAERSGALGREFSGVETVVYGLVSPLKSTLGVPDEDVGGRPDMPGVDTLELSGALPDSTTGEEVINSSSSSDVSERPSESLKLFSRLILPSSYV